MERQPTPGEITGLAAGAVMLIASFLPFYEFDLGGTVPGLSLSQEFSAWSNDVTLFPLTALVAVLVAAVAVRIALVRFGVVEASEPLARWARLDLAHGVLVLATMLAYLLRDVDPYDRGIGFWLMLAAAVAVVVGAMLRDREAAL